MGSTIEAWRRDNTGTWVKLDEAVDSRYEGIGYVGVGIRRTSGRLDDFGAATLREALPDASVAIDDFNRPDEQPLSDGGAWSTLNGYQLKVAANQLACSQPGATCQSRRSDVQYGPDQEAWIRIETKQEYASQDAAWVRLHVRLQTPAFSGYALRYNNWNGIDQVLLERTTNGASTVLATYSQEVLIGDMLRIRAIGSTIEAWHRPNSSGTWTKLGDVTDSTYSGSGYLGVGIRRTTGRLDDFGGGSTVVVQPEALLELYAPELRYDTLDTFRADSAAMMTGNYQPSYSNTLIVPSVGFLAQANPDLPEDDLSLAYLGSSYPAGGIGQGRAATLDDYIDAENGTYEADAQRMQVAPGKAYGRVLPSLNGGTILQYWFFYYFNWHPTWTNLGDHEGDWELIQIELDTFGVAMRATYAQHGGGETCSWSQVLRTPAGAPIVFVAQGSHASYFRAGSKPISGTAPGGDEVSGDAVPVTPSIDEINPPAPGWLDWPGKWGWSEGAAPRGPAQQADKWLTPESWADDQTSCWEASAARRMGDESVPVRPSAPKIVAKRIGKMVKVTYSFAVWSRDMSRRPATLITSVQPRETRFAPLVHRYRIIRRSGSYARPLGLGTAPYKLTAAAYTKQGRSSARVVVRVRGG